MQWWICRHCRRTQRNDPTPAAWGVICATGARVCDDERHVVLSGIALEPLVGGNMPTGTVWEEQAYYNATSSSSWTGVAFTLFTAALTYAFAGAYGLAMGSAQAGTLDWLPKQRGRRPWPTQVAHLRSMVAPSPRSNRGGWPRWVGRHQALAMASRLEHHATIHIAMVCIPL